MAGCVVMPDCLCLLRISIRAILEFTNYEATVLLFDSLEFENCSQVLWRESVNRCVSFSTDLVLPGFTLNTEVNPKCWGLVSGLVKLKKQKH